MPHESPQTGSHNPVSHILQVVDGYRQALNQGDQVLAVSSWDQSNQTILVLPSGQALKGYALISAMLSQLLSQRRITITLLEADVRCLQPDVYCVFSLERLHYEMGEDIVEGQMYCTYVVRKHHEKWVLSHVHCSESRDGDATPLMPHTLQ